MSICTGHTGQKPVAGYNTSMSIVSRHTSAKKSPSLSPVWARPELDYAYISSMLSGMAKPRDRVTRWLASGELIRVKKGLYVAPRAGPYSMGVLANLIYGPSYVSLEYALAYHGLIPERVEELTSISLARDKSFTTPVGRFTYRKLTAPSYAIGVTQAAVDDQRHYLIATPEKALADLLWVRRHDVAVREVGPFLTDEMRIAAHRLGELSARRARAIAASFKCQQVTQLALLIADA